MPIEETENEIRARIREPSDFAEIYGYIDIDKERGIRAIYGRLKTGKNAIQAYRFNKTNGWTIEKARRWLQDHDIKVTQSQMNFGKNYLTYEHALFKDIGPEYESILRQDGNFHGPPIRLYDVADRFAPGPFLKDQGRIFLIGNLVGGVTVGPIRFGLMGHVPEEVLQLFKDRLTPKQRERSVFHQLSSLPSRYIEILSADYKVNPIFITEKIPEIDSLAIQDPIDLREDMLTAEMFPVHFGNVPVGARLKIFVFEDTVRAADIDGQEITLTANQIPALKRTLGTDGVFLAIEKPDGGICLLDAERIEGEDISQLPFGERFAKLKSFMGQKKYPEVFVWSIAQSKEELLAHPGDKLVMWRNHKAILSKDAMLLNLQVLAVKEKEARNGNDYSYLMGIPGKKPVYLGMTKETKWPAKAGDILQVLASNIGAHRDTKTGEIWFNAEMTVTGPGNRLASTYLSPLELSWSAKYAHPFPAPNLSRNLRTGTISNEWNMHLANALGQMFFNEKLEERIMEEEWGFRRVQLSGVWPVRNGSWILHRHTSNGEVNLHKDLRLEMNGYAETWTILGGDCGCPEACKPCPVDVKFQALDWLDIEERSGGTPDEVSTIEKLDRGIYFPGIFSTNIREYFLKSFIPNSEIVHLVFTYKDGMWSMERVKSPPLILSEEYWPEPGYSCLPPEVEEKIPLKLRFWDYKDPNEGKMALIALRQAYNKKEVRLNSQRVRIQVECGIENFTLQNQIDLKKGEIQKVHLRYCNYALHEIWGDGDKRGEMKLLGQVLHLNLKKTMSMMLGPMVKSGESETAKILYTFPNWPADLLAKSGRVNPSVFNDDHFKEVTELKLIEMGKVLLIDDRDGEAVLSFKGEILKGRYVLKYEDGVPKQITRFASPPPTEKLSPLPIEGIALTEGVFNGKKYPESEVKKAVLKPEEGNEKVLLRADHSDSVWDIVGEVNELHWDPEHAYRGRTIAAQVFKAIVKNEDIAQAIVNGDIDAVSIGADVDVEEGNPPIVHDIEIREISLVSVPACKDCRIEKIG